jgi:hypothetical protein
MYRRHMFKFAHFHINIHILISLWEMIFEHPFFNNFCDNPLSHTLIVLLFSLFLFPSLLLLSNKKRGKMLSLKVVGNWMSKYHSSYIFPHTLMFMPYMLYTLAKRIVRYIYTQRCLKVYLIINYRWERETDVLFQPQVCKWLPTFHQVPFFYFLQRKWT